MFAYQWADGRKIGFEEEPTPEELNHAFDADMHDRISTTAQKYGVPAPLALGVAKTESNMDQTDAQGNLLHNPESSAIGVFQLTKAARKDVGLKDNADVDAHIDGGIRYLKKMYEQEDGDWDKAIAAYKQGAGSLNSKGEDADTQTYKKKVYSWGQRLGAGVLKLGGAGLGAVGGGALGGIPGAMAGTVGGYGTGKAAAEGLGLEEPSSLGDKAVEAGRVGTDVVGGMVGGLPGFLLADTAGKVVQDKFQSGGESEVLAPSQTSIGGTQPFNFPGGELAQNAVVNAGADLGLRGIIGAGKGYVGYNNAKGLTEEALKGGNEALQAEREAVAPKMETALGEQGIKQGYADQDFQAKSEQALEAAKRQTQTQQGPQAAQQSFEAMVGPKPGERIIDPADGGVPSEAAAQARQRQAQAVFAPQQRIQEQLGKQYEDLLQPHGDQPVKPEALNGLVRDTTAQRIQLQEWGKEGDLSREANDLLVEAQSIANRHSPNGGLEPTTMRDLLNLRSRASGLFANGATPLDQSVGHRVVDNTLRAMEQGGFETEALRTLNTKYKFFRDSFNGVNRQVSKGMDPGDWGKRIFSRPDAAVRLWDQALPAERDQLRSALGEYIYSRKDMRGALNEIGPETLGRYFGKGPLSNARIWMETEPRLVEFDKLIDESPQARQAFTDGFNRRMAVIQAERDETVVKGAIALSKKLGPAGKEFQQQIFQTPQAQKGQVAQDWVDSINPAKAAEKFAAGQQTPDALAIKALGSLSSGNYSKILKDIAIRNGSIAAGEMLLRGHPGLFTVGSTVHAFTKLPSTIMKEMWIKALRNPETAAKFIKFMRSGKVAAMGPLIADTEVAIHDAQQKDNK